MAWVAGWSNLPPLLATVKRWRPRAARVGILPGPKPMTPAPNTVLASSAGWVAVLLNLVPGLGTGYIYQRRWKAYWISSAITTSWFVLGAVLGQDQPSADLQRNQAIGLAGLVLVAAITAMEAGLATRRCRQG